jgi:hypothetical protein
MPPPSEETELGADPTQLCRIVDATKAHLRRFQEEIEQAIEALNKLQ